MSDFSRFLMYRNLEFLHMTDFSPHVSFVNYVTNMRYDRYDEIICWGINDHMLEENNHFVGGRKVLPIV